METKRGLNNSIHNIDRHRTKRNGKHCKHCKPFAHFKCVRNSTYVTITNSTMTPLSRI